MNTRKEAIEILQALEDGKTVQFKDPDDGEWIDSCDEIPSFTEIDYRIKPEPRTFYVVRSDNGCHVIMSDKLSAVNWVVAPHLQQSKEVIKVIEVIE